MSEADNEYYRNHKDEISAQRKVSGSARKANADYRTPRLAYVNSFKAAPCMDCGVQYPPYVMDFDHRDPGTKIASIGQMISGWSFETIAAEIAKCDLVCSNCHRERTHGERYLLSQQVKDKC